MAILTIKSSKMVNLNDNNQGFKARYQDNQVQYIIMRKDDSRDDLYDGYEAKKKQSSARQFAKFGALAAALWGIIESVNTGISISLLKSPRFHRFISKRKHAKTITAFALPAALIAGVSAIMGMIGYVADKVSKN